MASPQKSRGPASYTTRLDKTLKALQDRVKEQEAVLRELRLSAGSIETDEPSLDLKTHLLQLRVFKGAFDTLNSQEPWLPSSDSPLPGLLALRRTDACIKETQECITKTDGDLLEAQQRLEKEQGYLSDAKIIQNELETRISFLRRAVDDRIQKSSSQIAKDMIRDLMSKREHYDNETSDLVRGFNGFIDDHLAPLLAAEELGGPVVGDNLDVTEEMLEAGFSSQGKVKKSKAQPNEDKRQRRIDQIWGPRVGEDEPWNEERAAGAEMRELTEQLLNSLIEAGDTGPGAYVELQRESAASRFLVRSKVAQFHPKDATRLRLVDFGSELDG